VPLQKLDDQLAHRRLLRQRRAVGQLDKLAFILIGLLCDHLLQ
jgi:hypothetical protein